MEQGVVGYCDKGKGGVWYIPRCPLRVNEFIEMPLTNR